MRVIVVEFQNGDLGNEVAVCADVDAAIRKAANICEDVVCVDENGGPDEGILLAMKQFLRENITQDALNAGQLAVKLSLDGEDDLEMTEPDDTPSETNIQLRFLSTLVYE